MASTSVSSSPPLAASPGPRGHWLFGSLPEYERDPLRHVAAVARDYGDFVPLRFMRSRLYLVSNPLDIEKILMAREGFVKNRALLALSDLFGDGLLTAEGQLWRQRRLSDQQAFRREHLPQYCRAVVSKASRIADGWREGQTQDIYACAKRLTLASACSAFFGIDSTEEENAVIETLESAMTFYSERRTLWGLLGPSAPTPTQIAFRRATRRLDDLARRLLAAPSTPAADDDPRGSLLRSLQAQRAAGEISDEQARDEVRTFLTAGFDAPSLALTWSWYLLAQHPDIEQEMCEEVSRVLNGRLPTYEDITSLRYMEGVVREAMRLYPPVWSQGRQATAPCNVNGYELPAGSNFVMSQWIVHRDERWFDNPEEFRPQRWTPEFIKSLPRCAYFPFGAGPRVCIGAAFGMSEAILVLATVAQRWRLRLAPDFKLELWPSITLRPRNGMPMTVRSAG